MIPTRQEFREALAARHGEAYQAKLSEARVAICGLGGLGSNIAIALARAGVGQLRLVDFDRVDISNLNRQQYKVSQLGKLKTEAMRENLLEIAPYCEISTDAVRLDEETGSAGEQPASNKAAPTLNAVSNGNRQERRFSSYSGRPVG